MRDLNPEELKEYLQFCKTSEHQMPENWQPESTATEIQDTIRDHHFLHLQGDFELDVYEHGTEDALVAMWLTAFQCGREFETRHQESKELEGMVK